MSGKGQTSASGHASHTLCRETPWDTSYFPLSQGCLSSGSIGTAFHGIYNC